MSSIDGQWAHASARYQLPPDEVHVWRASIDQGQESIARLLGVLPLDERRRAEAFHFEADRRRSLVARGMLRLVLAHCLGQSADQLRFASGAFGKPRLAAGHDPIEFNVSHSGEFVLLALHRSCAVGVDIEAIRADRADRGVAEHFFSAKECRALRAVAPEQWPEAFFSCWTRKEAYLKGKGAGLSLPLDSFDVALLPGERPRLLETRHEPADAQRWSLTELDAGPGYKAALAVEGAGWTLRRWQWPPADLTAAK